MMGERLSELCCGMFHHVKIILEAYKTNSGLSWFSYYECFCQKLAVHKSLKWGTKDMGLWLNLYLADINMSVLLVQVLSGFQVL